MGYGLSAVIGTCIASGRTIIFEGDRSLQHNLQELQLLKIYKLPIKLFIYNNEGYFSIYGMQNNHFNGRLAGCMKDSGLVLPKLKNIAYLYGVSYIKISGADVMKEEIHQALSDNSPMICETIGDIRYEEILRIQTKVNPDGTLTLDALQDLY